MSENTKKRSRKSKLVPRTLIDLDELTQNDKLQSTSPVSSSNEPEDCSESPESSPALIPFTVKVEVESGDDDDDWWKELEEQAKKEKDAQNETQPDENVTVKSEPLEVDDNSLNKEDNKTNELEPEDWNCKNYILSTEKITAKSEAKLSEKDTDKFESHHCHKTDIRTSLDDKNNETDLKPDKISGEPRRTLKLKLLGNGSKKFLFSKVQSKSEISKTAIRTSLDDKTNEEDLHPEKILSETSKTQSKPASSTKTLKRASNNILSNEEDIHPEKILSEPRKSQSKPAFRIKRLKRASSNILSVGKKIKPTHDFHSKSKETNTLLKLESPAQYYSKSVHETLRKLHESSDINTEIVIQSYKCYECKSSWEHYYNFSEHLIMVHDQIILSIGIEMVKNPFINVIAAILRKNIVFQDNFKLIEDGLEVYKCLKCKTKFSSATELEAHKKSVLTCVCQKTKPCHEMTNHQGNCKDFLEFQLKKCQCGRNTKNCKGPHKPSCLSKQQRLTHQCPVCFQTFPSEQTLFEHQTVYHMVRSDEFMLKNHSICMFCWGVYIGDRLSHFCPKLSDECNCKECGRQFQNNLFLRLHWMAYKEAVPCETCGNILLRACQQEQHNVFLHDSGFRVVHKCNICGQLFQNEFNVSKHVLAAHKKENAGHTYTRSWVLLPKDKISINYPRCEIVNTTSNTEDKEVLANWSNWETNAIKSYYENEIKKHSDILATAIRHRVVSDNKIIYECKHCEGFSSTNISDFLSHVADHREIAINFSVDYAISPKIIAHIGPTQPAPNQNKVALVKKIQKQIRKNTAETQASRVKENTVNLSKQFQKSIHEVVSKSLNKSLDRKILSFKCYVCSMSWEHYTGFREHLIEHTEKSDDDIYISSETTNENFVCIVALQNAKGYNYGDLPVIDESGTEVFKCLKCKEIHLTKAELLRHKFRTFACKGCLFRGSCFKVKAHEGNCRRYFDSLDYITCECGVTCENKEDIEVHRQRCSSKAFGFRCVICSSQYPMKDLLTKHQVELHTVRSDEFVVNTLYTCPLCSAVFVPSKLKYHQCPKRSDKVHCKWCKRQFQNKYFLSVHAKAYKRNSKLRCKKCNMALGSECVRDEHEVIFHERGDSAILVFKCNLCKDMFVNEQAAVKHVSMIHPDKERASFVYHYKKMIVPREEVVIIRDSFVLYKDDQNVEKPLNQASTSVDNIDYEMSITQSIVVKADIPVTNKDNTEKVVVKEEKIDEQENITENAPDIPDDTSEPDEFRLVIKEEVFDEPMEEAFEAIENSMDAGIDENVVKQEVKFELTELEEMIVMDEYQNVKQEAEETIDQFIKNHSEITMMEIEPEVLLNSHGIVSENAQKSSKIYTCKKCKFSGIHSLYRYHKHECTRFKSKKKKTVPLYGIDSLMNIVCSKCKKEYDDLILYLNHLKHHSVPNDICPECKNDFDCPAKLKSHVVHHVRTNFIRMSIIKGVDADLETLKKFNCVKCKDIVEKQSFFQHWESHLNLDDFKVKTYSKKTEKEHSSLEEVKVKTYAKETDKGTESAKNPDSQEDSNSMNTRNLDPESRKYLIDSLREDYVRKNKCMKTCQLCDRIFGRNNDMKRHLIEHLFDEARANKVTNDGLKCPICSVVYPTNDVFKKHMRDHASLPMYQCHLCDKTFSDSSNFAKHKKVHGLRVLVCDVCGRKFQSKKQLEVHILKHMRKCQMRCSECGMEFFYESLYNKHMKRFHGPDGVATVTFCCSVCRQRFATLKHKWDHEWEVHKERKTKADCPICGIKFRKFNDVKKHIRSEHDIQVSKSSYKFCNLLDTISKYNVPVEVVEELLRKETSVDGAGSSS